MVKTDKDTENKGQEEHYREEVHQNNNKDTMEEIINEIRFVNNRVAMLDKELDKVATKEDWEKAFKLANKPVSQKDKDSHPLLTQVRYLAMMLVIFSLFFLVSLTLFNTCTSLWVSIPLYLANLFGWSAFIQEIFEK